MRVGSLDGWIDSTAVAGASQHGRYETMVHAGWDYDQYLAYLLDVECGLPSWAEEQERWSALESMNVYTFLGGKFVKQWSCTSFDVRSHLPVVLSVHCFITFFAE